MASGIRFFGTNYGEIGFGGSTDSSSNTSFSEYAFDDLNTTKWYSSGEDTDGDAVYLERTLATSQSVDSIFVYNTNISDISFQYWNGSSYTNITNGVNATITKKTDNTHIYVGLDSSISTTKIKINGSNTIISDEEKEITRVYIFEDIGQLTYYPEPRNRMRLVQSDLKLINGKHFVIERGDTFETELDFKSHVLQSDIDLFETLVNRKEALHIWLNGGDEAQFTYTFKPYRFQDIFKVAVIKDIRPEYTDNYYKAGLNSKLKFIEVA